MSLIVNLDTHMETYKQHSKEGDTYVHLVDEEVSPSGLTSSSSIHTG